MQQTTADKIKTTPKLTIEQACKKYSVKYTKAIRSVYDHLCNEPKKGLILIGPVGTGKTFAFKFMQRFVPRADWYSIVLMQHVSREYSQNGSVAIDKYGRHSFQQEMGKEKKYFRQCFDDIGREELKKYYGDTGNCFEEIISDRYMNWIDHGQITHGTTNLNREQIKGFYGDYIMDRLNEMCVFVECVGESLRK